MKAGRTPARPVETGRILLALAAAVLLTFLGGCATGGSSDMPWNTPQSWEGSPTVPGFQGR
jgi:hypothetical protein